MSCCSKAHYTNVGRLTVTQTKRVEGIIVHEQISIVIDCSGLI